MSKPGSTFRAYLELARISNLPTVWANVMVGYAVAMMPITGDNVASEAVTRWWPMPAWAYAMAAAVAVSFLYIAGMALNDVADAKVDRRERSRRPIPSGRVTVRGASRFVLLFAVLGMGILAALHWMALVFGFALLLAIFIYDYTHKQFPQSVVIMGLCRFLVYFVAAAAVNARFDLRAAEIVGAIMGVYTIAITIVARAEARGTLDTRKWLALLMPVLVLAAAKLIDKPPQSWLWVIIAGVALVAWLALPVRFVMAQPPRTIKAVMCWLSGMCLVDAYFLTLLDQPLLAPAAGGCFVLTAWGHRHIMGT